MRNQGGIADLIVKGAIALVTAAFFIGAYLQFQVTFWLALIAALSVYIALLMLHSLMRRSERVDALVSEVTRLEDELANFKGGGSSEYVPPARGTQPAVRGAPMPARADMRAPSRPDSRSPQLSMPAVPSPRAPTLQTPPPPAPEPAAPRSELTSGLPPWPSPTGGPASAPDYWSFRPERPQFPETPEARRKEAAPFDSTRETDLDAVQGMIKRLANEVSLGDAGSDAGRASQDGLLRASVDALHTTADNMRAATRKAAPAHRDRGAGSAMPPPIAPGHARLSSVAEAIAARRMDVCLEPIVGLADHRLHHYEVIVRPRDEKGDLLSLAGQDRQMSRTGLLPLIDAARLKWAARMAGSFAEKGQKHCLFSAASAESLTADRFLDELATVYRQREAFAAELVLMFSQSDVKTFSGIEWSGLTDMRDLGFRFGLMEVTDLDYEFTALKAAGFVFVRLDAASLLKGLPGPGGFMSGADICRYLGELGLTIIVDRIGDEATRAAVLEAGVPLGEGALFGPPVMVEPGTLGASGTAAA